MPGISKALLIAVMLCDLLAICLNFVRAIAMEPSWFAKFAIGVNTALFFVILLVLYAICRLIRRDRIEAITEALTEKESHAAPP